MNYVLGMAKRSLNLKGAKRQKLELDLLRLIYAKRTLIERGVATNCYFVVTKPVIEAAANQWMAKYEAEGLVTVLQAELSEYEKDDIKREAAENRNGMISGTLGETGAERSCATAGASILERHLAHIIEKREPGVKRLDEAHEMPFGIRWDYYGIVEA